MAQTAFQSFFTRSAEPFAMMRRIPGDPEPDYQLTQANGAYAEIVGLPAATLVGQPLRKLFASEAASPDPDQNRRWFAACAQALQTGQPVFLDIPWRARALWLRATLFPLSDDMLGLVVRNISREYLQDQEIEGFLRVNLDMLCVTDREARFLRVNHAFEQVLGYVADELEGHLFTEFIHPEDLGTLENWNDQLRQTRFVTGLVNRYRHKDGSWRYLEWRALLGEKHVYSSARDITAYKEMEHRLQAMTADLKQQISHLETVSVTDELTGLFNRHHFETRLEQEAERADRHDTPLSMALLDIDRFKRLNDTWGHPVGDEVLRAVARVLTDTCRKSDSVFRVGGEEFVVLMPETPALGAVAAAEKIRQALSEAHHPIAGAFTASFGVALRERGESTRRWYKRADAALYQAKETGRNRVVLAEEALNAPVASVQLEWRSEWETGQTEVDRQHRDLLEVASGLINMSLAAMAPAKVLLQLDLLLHHIAQHFRYEERILALSVYPETAHHGKLHAELLRKAALMRNDYEKGDLHGTAFFSFVVDDVILGHMKVADAKYIPWLKEHPVKEV
jgi:diguanylate cyclase (GGDEF)-like protein/hemerythrin-like metal-binding protein/PAS domain S-box-containing protein